MKPLTIAAWNIQGLHSSSFGPKTKTLEFYKNRSNIEIIILQETWRRNNEVTLCPIGYKEISLSSKKHKGTNRGRDSGVVIIWYKHAISQFVTLAQKEDLRLWLKINKELTQTTNDIFLCAGYIPPPEYPYCNMNIFDILQLQIN